MAGCQLWGPKVLDRQIRVGSLLLLLAGSLSADEPKAVKIDDPLPYGHSAIDYLGQATSDRIADVNRRLVAGSVQLTAVPDRGYLDSVLKQFEVPVSSQLLVYSKTAVNQRLISPRTPRALYFNDSVYVAWVPGTAELELAAIDPLKGGMFYVLKQPSAAGGQPPRFERRQSCLACHIGRTTLSVPGFMVRSFQVDQTGKPLHGYSRMTGVMPLEKRWGGWFVTGSPGDQVHVGNLVSSQDNAQHKKVPGFRSQLKRLNSLVDLSGYLSCHSDLVAHLVLDHQLHGQNLIFRVGYEHRLNRRSDVQEQLLRYLLLVDAAPLSGPVSGTSGFATWFQRQGPRTTDGTSLRQLDLKRRLFRHRLSYLVYSPALASLPGVPRRRLGRRLWKILDGHDTTPLGKSLNVAERAAVAGILQATADRLPKEWRRSP
jgi:hypothetical protein